MSAGREWHNKADCDQYLQSTSLSQFFMLAQAVLGATMTLSGSVMASNYLSSLFQVCFLTCPFFPVDSCDSSPSENPSFWIKPHSVFWYKTCPSALVSHSQVSSWLQPKRPVPPRGYEYPLRSVMLFNCLLSCILFNLCTQLDSFPSSKLSFSSFPLKPYKRIYEQT